jgi:GT2 family glycosyltransferase
MKVAVVILNWNGAHYMEQFLPVLQKHTPASLATIIVADNGSTDNSISLLKEKFKEIRLIQFDQNYSVR